MTDTTDTSDNGSGRLRKFFGAAIRLEASDLIIRPDVPIKFRLRGALQSADAKAFTNEELEHEINAILDERQQLEFHNNGSADLAYSYDEDNRFRVNVFRTMGQPALAARRVSSEILNFEQLHLPPVMEQIADATQGLVLLCGVTGSGKSTTIASMLQRVNQNRACHILTLEDPVEYLFRSEKALVNQREIGIDVPDFTTGLRALVRENPDVVLIGEMRDRETFEAAVQAAETGHLVFGTIHASSCAGAFGRIYNLFPTEERGLVREMLGQTMVAFVYQRLMKTLVPEIARVPAVEVLLNNPVVRKQIMDGNESELGDVIKANTDGGMIDLTSSLVDLVNRQYIHPKVAQAAARNPDELKMRLKGIVTGTG